MFHLDLASRPSASLAGSSSREALLHHPPGAGVRGVTRRESEPDLRGRRLAHAADTLERGEGFKILPVVGLGKSLEMGVGFVVCRET